MWDFIQSQFNVINKNPLFYFAFYSVKGLRYSGSHDYTNDLPGLGRLLTLHEDETNQELRKLTAILSGKGPGPVKFMNDVAIAYFKSLENHCMPDSQYDLARQAE